MRRSTDSIAILFIITLFAAPLLVGCGTSRAASPRTPTAQPHAAAPTATSSPADAPTPRRDVGTLSWEERNYTVTVHTLIADANLIVLGFTVEDKSLSPEANKDVRWVASPILLTTLGGARLPAQENEIGWEWSPGGSGQATLIGTRAAFDATPLTTTSNTLDLHLVANLVAEPSGARSYPPGEAPSPQPTVSLHMAPVHIARDIRIPFDPLRRIAEPRLTVEGRGVALTLDRVQVTASETRLYITGKMPRAAPGGGPQLSGDGWSLSMNYGGFEYVSSKRVEGTDQYLYRIGASLLDRPGPWVLTLPAVTEVVPPGSLAEHGPWRGPWRFRFGLPPAEASLTPGPMPSLPPATPWPTDVPGAEPTFVGPLHGPVPPTATP